MENDDNVGLRMYYSCLPSVRFKALSKTISLVNFLSGNHKKIFFYPYKKINRLSYEEMGCYRMFTMGEEQTFAYVSKRHEDKIVLISKKEHSISYEINDISFFGEIGLGNVTNANAFWRLVTVFLNKKIQFSKADEYNRSDNILDLFGKHECLWNREFRLDRYVHNFVIGAGLSFDYGSLQWSKLIEKMENSLSKVINCPSIEMIKDFFSIPYAIPQVLSDVKPQQYWSDIYYSLYGEKNEVGATTITALKLIAEILSYEGGQVVTLNYDDFLEEELRRRGCSFASECRTLATEEKQRISINPKPILISHIHGFLPCFSPILNGKITEEKRKGSIVLDEKEYNTAYRSKSSYAFRTFYSFLDNNCCFVGNSMKDYEERKLIRTHFDANLNFHIALMKRSDDLKWDYYLFSFLLSIGVIVIWFDDYSFINQYLSMIADGASHSNDSPNRF